MKVFSKHVDDNLEYTEKVLLNCFSSETYSAMDRQYQDPEAVALLALACRLLKDKIGVLAVSKQRSEQ